MSKYDPDACAGKVIGGIDLSADNLCPDNERMTVRGIDAKCVRLTQPSSWKAAKSA